MVCSGCMYDKKLSGKVDYLMICDHILIREAEKKLAVVD